jgi:hypothetical protein
MASRAERREDGTRIWQRPDAHFEIRMVTPSVVLDKIVGIIDDDLAATVAVAFEEILSRAARPHTFHDWSEVAGYSPGARKLLTDAVAAQRPRMRSVHILFSSRVLAMGISVANVVLGGYIKAYGDRESFRAAYEDALRES